MVKYFFKTITGFLVGISDVPENKRTSNYVTPYSTYILLERKKLLLKEKASENSNTHEKVLNLKKENSSGKKVI